MKKGHFWLFLRQNFFKQQNMGYWNFKDFLKKLSPMSVWFRLMLENKYEKNAILKKTDNIFSFSTALKIDTCNSKHLWILIILFTWRVDGFLLWNTQYWYQRLHSVPIKSIFLLSMSWAERGAASLISQIRETSGRSIYLRLAEFDQLCT